jgi:hypothetical protein
MVNAVRQSRRLGTIGSTVGLLALLASVLTQLLPAVFPPEPFFSDLSSLADDVRSQVQNGRLAVSTVTAQAERLCPAPTQRGRPAY